MRAHQQAQQQRELCNENGSNASAAAMAAAMRAQQHWQQRREHCRDPKGSSSCSGSDSPRHTRPTCAVHDDVTLRWIDPKQRLCGVDKIGAGDASQNVAWQHHVGDEVSVQGCHLRGQTLRDMLHIAPSNGRAPRSCPGWRVWDGVVWDGTAPRAHSLGGRPGMDVSDACDQHQNKPGGPAVH
eukprot:366576-Chlamydomonas_euryale.AAC.5